MTVLLVRELVESTTLILKIILISCPVVRILLPHFPPNVLLEIHIYLILVFIYIYENNSYQ